MKTRIVFPICSRMYQRFSTSLVQRALLDDRCQVILIAREHAHALDLRKDYPDCEVLDGYTPQNFAQANPAVLVVYQLWWYSMPELLAPFRAKGIPIYHVDHGSPYQKSAYLFDGNEDLSDYRTDIANCSHIACWGERSKECWTSFGTLPHKFRVTGAPHLDQVQALNPNREQLMQKLGLQSTDRIMLVCSGLVGIPSDAVQKEFLRMLPQAVYAVDPTLKIVWKPHPVEVVRFGVRNIQGLESAIIVQNEIERLSDDPSIRSVDMEALFSCAAFLFGPRSSVILSPMFFQVPIVTMDMQDGLSGDFLNYFQNAVIPVKTPADMASAFQKALALGKANLHGFYQTLNYVAGTGATERVLEEIIEVAGTRYPYEPIMRELEKTVQQYPFMPYPRRNLIRAYARIGNFHAMQRSLLDYLQRFQHPQSLVTELANMYRGTSKETSQILDKFPALFVHRPPTAFQTRTTDAPLLIWVMETPPTAARWLELRLLAEITGFDRRAFAILPACAFQPGQFPVDLQPVLLPISYPHHISWIRESYRVLFDDEATMPRVELSLLEGARPILLGEPKIPTDLKPALSLLRCNDFEGLVAFASDWVRQDVAEGMMCAELLQQIKLWKDNVGSQIEKWVVSGQIQRAFEFVLDALPFAPYHGELWNFLGYAEYTRKNHAAARDHFETAWRFSHNANIAANLSDTLHMLGKKDRALAISSAAQRPRNFRSEFPLVSVLIAAYNEEHFVVDAVESCLKQSYPNVEVVVVDDGSTDRTWAVLQEHFVGNPRVKRIQQPKNVGKVPAFNVGFAAAEGECIALLGADDVSFPDRVERGMRYLRWNDLDGVFGGFMTSDATLNPLFRFSPYFDREKYTLDHALQMTVSSGSTSLIRRTLAEVVFPIPEHLRFEDWWMGFVALSNNFKLDYLPGHMIRYRIHGNNDSTGNYPWNTEKSRYKDWRRHPAYYDAFIARLEQDQSQYEGDKTRWLRMIQQGREFKAQFVEAFAKLQDQEKIPVKVQVPTNVVSRNLVRWMILLPLQKASLRAQTLRWARCLTSNPSQQIEFVCPEFSSHPWFDISDQEYLPGGHTFNRLRIPCAEPRDLLHHYPHEAQFLQWCHQREIKAAHFIMDPSIELSFLEGIHLLGIPFTLGIPTAVLENEPCKDWKDALAFYARKACCCIFEQEPADVKAWMPQGGKYLCHSLSASPDSWEQLFYAALNKKL